MRRAILYVIASILMCGCENSTEKSSALRSYFFDADHYFSDLAIRLNRENPVIFKQVSKNNRSEKKRIQIQNWKDEFGLFIGTNINKPALKGSYLKDSTTNKVIYKALDSTLKTQLLEVSYVKNKPVKIRILTNTKNLLYQTSEELIYHHQKSYEIKKFQKVILLGTNEYYVIGSFN